MEEEQGLNVKWCVCVCVGWNVIRITHNTRTYTQATPLLPSPSHASTPPSTPSSSPPSCNQFLRCELHLDDPPRLRGDGRHEGQHVADQ